MRAEQYARAKALFAEVCDLPEPERDAHLRTATEDVEIIRFVRALADQSETRGARIAQPVRDAIELLGAEQLKPGDVLDAWKLVAPIGQGGMGSLFLVERSDGHFQQRAALKVLKGLPHAQALELLARERQLLASLSHPNIARLLDGGATPSGQPFLVMEYIDGQAIDQYCRAHQLSRAAIVRLFLRALPAVAFAHRQLVVHCDLKPANLLVNTEGRPMLLDFGIARLVDRSAAEHDNLSPAYTPGYASPEQRRREPVTVLSDVYSLGVLLGELLELPVMPGRGLRERELQAIVRRCSAEDPAQRYGSVDALSDDLDRWRQHKPVRALDGGALYVARRTWRRHWPLFATGGLLVLTILLFSGRLLLESERARAAEAQALAQRDRAQSAERNALAERDRALRSEASSRQISDFLVSIFEYSGPDAGTGNVPTATLIDAALKRVEVELKEQPATQAELYAALAGAQHVMGNAAGAQANLDKAIALERTQQRPLVLARLLQQQATQMVADIQPEAALTPADEALALTLGSAPPESEAAAQAWETSGRVHQSAGRRDAALKALSEALRIRQALAADSIETARSLRQLGSSLDEFGESERGVGLLREAQAAFRTLRGESDAEYMTTLQALGSALQRLRRYAEAEAVQRESLAIHRRVHGDSAATFWALNELGRVLASAGRPREALPLYEEAAVMGAQKIGVDSPSMVVLLNNHALACMRAGLDGCAARTFSEAIAIVERLWGGDDTRMPRVHLDQAIFMLRSGRLADARPRLQRALEMARAAGQDGAAQQAEIMLLQAEWAIRADAPAQARRWLEQLTPLRKQLSSDDQAALSRVEALVAAAGDDPQATEAAFEASAKHHRETYGKQDARYWQPQVEFAVWLVRQSDPQRKARGQRLAALCTRQLQKLMAAEAYVFRVLRQVKERD